MNSLSGLTRKLALDFALLGIAGGVALGLWRGPSFGAAFALSCLWLGLNVVLLALLIAELSTPKRRRGLLAFSLACAKLPAAYLLLFWLFTREYLDTMGLVAGLTTLPVVVVLRGLAELRATAAGEKATLEEQA